MKKYFLALLFWEIFRFILLVSAARERTGSDIIIWLSAQQTVMFYLFFFLWYNTEKYSQYMKAAAAGKFTGLAAGAAYLAKKIIGTSPVAGVLFVSNLLLVDLLVLISLLFLANKYFKEITRE